MGAKDLPRPKPERLLRLNGELKALLGNECEQKNNGVSNKDNHNHGGGKISCEDPRLEYDVVARHSRGKNGSETLVGISHPDIS